MRVDAKSSFFADESQNLAGLLERPPGEKRLKVGVRTESGRDKCAGW